GDLAGRCGFEEPPLGYRSIVVVDVTRIADSCGYGVPLMSYEGERPHQRLSAEKRLRTHGPTGFLEYQRDKNSESIDGLPAIEL
ncbi:MAG: pyridoxamine 5'-phosphate oxidase family protein, partial [Thermoleophilaceae bacterium]